MRLDDDGGTGELVAGAQVLAAMDRRVVPGAVGIEAGCFRLLDLSPRPVCGERARVRGSVGGRSKRLPLTSCRRHGSAVTLSPLAGRGRRETAAGGFDFERGDDHALLRRVETVALLVLGF